MPVESKSGINFCRPITETINNMESVLLSVSGRQKWTLDLDSTGLNT